VRAARGRGRVARSNKQPARRGIAVQPIVVHARSLSFHLGPAQWARGSIPTQECSNCDEGDCKPDGHQQHRRMLRLALSGRSDMRRDARTMVVAKGAKRTAGPAKLGYRTGRRTNAGHLRLAVRRRGERSTGIGPRMNEARGQHERGFQPSNEKGRGPRMTPAGRPGVERRSSGSRRAVRETMWAIPSRN
jgi:hypothetical protein